MLPGQDFSRSHECRLAASFDDRRGCEQRHHRLAGANVSLQEAQHPLRLREISNDLGDGSSLRGRKRVGQRVNQLLPELAGSRRRSACWPAQMRTHERERQLARQKFVIGKTRPCQSFRQKVGRITGPVEKAQRVGERGKPLARYPTWLLPFRQGRQAVERCHRGLAYLIEAQPVSQGIDRLDQRQLC